MCLYCIKCICCDNILDADKVNEKLKGKIDFEIGINNEPMCEKCEWFLCSECIVSYLDKFPNEYRIDEDVDGKFIVVNLCFECRKEVN